MSKMSELDSAFDFLNDFMKDGFGFLSTNPIVPSCIVSDVSFPPMNVYFDNDKSLVYEIAVAGIEEDRISIDFKDDHMLFEIAEKKTEGEPIKYLKHGIRSSCVKTRHFVPASKYKQTDAKASLKDGLLTVVIPVNPEAEAKRLEIKKV